MRRYSLLQPAFVGAAQEWRICNQGVAPLRNFPAASRPKAKLRSLLIRELAHLLPHPYWQTRLTSPFSKGETGLGTLATFFPPHSCPSHELRGSVDVKASHNNEEPQKNSSRHVHAARTSVSHTKMNSSHPAMNNAI